MALFTALSLYCRPYLDACSRQELRKLVTRRHRAKSYILARRGNNAQTNNNDERKFASSKERQFACFCWRERRARLLCICKSDGGEHAIVKNCGRSDAPIGKVARFAALKLSVGSGWALGGRRYLVAGDLGEFALVELVVEADGARLRRLRERRGGRQMRAGGRFVATLVAIVAHDARVGARRAGEFWIEGGNVEGWVCKLARFALAEMRRHRLESPSTALERRLDSRAKAA